MSHEFFWRMDAMDSNNRGLRRLAEERERETVSERPYDTLMALFDKAAEGPFAGEVPVPVSEQVRNNFGVAIPDNPLADQMEDLEWAARSAGITAGWAAKLEREKMSEKLSDRIRLAANKLNEISPNRREAILELRKFSEDTAALEAEVARLRQIEAAIQKDFEEHCNTYGFEEAAEQAYLNLRGESWHDGRELAENEVFIAYWALRYPDDADAKTKEEP